MLTPLPPSDCQRAREAVSAQLDGELSEVGSARLSAHLRDCTACAGYAVEAAAISTRLRAAPLERPTTPIELPSRRRTPGVRVAATAAVAAAAALASVTLGDSLSSSHQPGRTATLALMAPSLEQDVVNQHILAMERRLPLDPAIRVGRIVVL
jgi:predicted anti-sigma-YlaC factor YlaD